MEAVTLFTPIEEIERRQALLDFIREFRAQLKTCRNAAERRELKVAIRSYEAALNPPIPTKR